MPMFRMQVADLELKDTQEQSNEKWETEIQTALSKFEQAVQAEIESCGDRPSMHEALLHLFVCGNVLLYDSPDVGCGVKVYPLTRYVVDRDPMGAWREIIIHEKVSLKTLPSGEQQRIFAALSSMGNTEVESDDTFLDLYTHVTRNGEKCKSYQEIAGTRIEGTDGNYPLDGCPWIPLRMYWVAGEDYGRSYVENYLGDLKSLEALTQAIIEASAASAKVVFLTHPNGTTKSVDLQKTPNCGFITGSANDVTVLQVQKHADLRVALETVQMLTSRLAKAFMLMDGIRRDAERVTAEEIRAVASELEAGLGGLYSMLSQEFQLPYVKRKIHKLTRKGKLPVLPSGMVKPSIITGFEALGRGNDKTKLVSFVTALSQTIGQQALQQYLNLDDFIARLAASDGINTKGLIKTQEQITQEQQQAQQQQQQMEAMKALGPNAINMLGKAAQGGAISPEALADASQQTATQAALANERG